MILRTFKVGSQLWVAQQLRSEKLLGTREGRFLVWCVLQDSLGLLHAVPVFEMSWQTDTGVFNAPSPAHRLVVMRDRFCAVI